MFINQGILKHIKSIVGADDIYTIKVIRLQPSTYLSIYRIYFSILQC